MNKFETTQERLRMREAMLQARADMHLQQAKSKMDYLRTDGIRLVGNEVAQDLSTKSPIIAKAISYVTGNRESQKSTKRSLLNRYSNPRGNYIISSKHNNTLSLDGIKSAILPTLYTLGSMKLMAYSLKGTRKLVASGLNKLFGGKKNKK